MLIRLFAGKAFALAVFSVLLIPQSVSAQGMIPCGGPGQPLCQMCHTVELAQNFTTWLIAIMSIIAAIIIVIAGIQLVTSGGNPAAKTAAKSKIINVLIGYVIVLGCWLLIDLGMRMLVRDEISSGWNLIQCVEQPELSEGDRVNLTLESRRSASGLNANAMTSTETTAAARLIGSGSADCSTSASVYDQARCAAANAGLSVEQQNIYAALVHQESSGCRNMRSPAGAYGCSQLLLPTARSLDPSATVDRLLTDNAYNMALGAQYYAQQLASFGGDTRLALAAYNGGPGANGESRDCPGRRRWECEWDNAAQTVPNVGYRETRNYVNNIQNTARDL